MSATTNPVVRAADAFRQRFDAASAVVASSVALVAIIAGIFVLLCVQGYEMTLQMTRTRAENAADAVAEGTRWIVTSARATLEPFATGMAATGEAPDAGSVALLNGGAVAGGQFRLFVFDAAGNRVGPRPDGDAVGSIAQLPVYTSLAAGAEWAISAQERDPQTGEAAFMVARRLAADGAFRGVALLSVPATVLTDIATPQALGEGSTISIVRSDGWLVARTPSLPNPLNLAGTPAFQQLSAGVRGSYVSPASPADGVPRVVGFRHVDELGYIAVAAISTQTALGGLWRSIWIVSLLIAPIALAVLAGSLLTARVLRRTVSTSRSLATALERNEALFQEIHHRVKNNLQSVTALLRLHPISPELREEMSNRIFAMSAVHEHIYRTRNFSTVAVRDYVHTLVENIRGGYRSDLKLVEDIDDIAIDRDLATPLGLIINEVVANSFKHAFPGERPGTVFLSLKEDPDGRARLTIRDDGVGFDPETPSKGIGRRLVSRFAAQLKAEMQHTGADGAVFTLVFAPQPA